VTLCRGWHPSEVNKRVSDELKRSSVFFRKNRVTPSVAAPRDTYPNDATACSTRLTMVLMNDWFLWSRLSEARILERKRLFLSQWTTPVLLTTSAALTAAAYRSRGCATLTMTAATWATNSRVHHAAVCPPSSPVSHRAARRPASYRGSAVTTSTTALMAQTRPTAVSYPSFHNVYRRHLRQIP